MAARVMVRVQNPAKPPRYRAASTLVGKRSTLCAAVGDVSIEAA
jgi:hypothetical protein